MHCIQAFIPTLTCVSKQGHKNENTTKKKCGARHVDLWHDVSQTFSCLHEIHPNDLYVKSSDLIKPPEEFFQKTPPANSTLPAPGGRKSASHWAYFHLRSRKVHRRVPSSRKPLTLSPRPPSQPPQPPKTYIPTATSLHTDVCPSRPPGAVPLGDSWLQRLACQKWPRCFEETSKPIIRNRCAKSNHDSGSPKMQLATCPQFTHLWGGCESQISSSSTSSLASSSQLHRYLPHHWQQHQLQQQQQQQQQQKQRQQRGSARARRFDPNFAPCTARAWTRF